MTCKTCKYHQSDINDPQDRRMLELGYKLCSISTHKLKNARYLHVNAKACEKYIDNILK